MAPGFMASDDDWVEYIWNRLKEINKSEGKEISQRTIFDPPYEILPHLFLGSRNHAYDKSLLKELGVTHVLNCAHLDENVKTDADFYGDDMVYKGFEAKDNTTYDMTQHIEESFQFINGAKASGGKVLVHCAQGINRSGLITIAYCMLEMRWHFLKAFEHCAKIRVSIIYNRSFQKQLIRWSRAHALLYSHKRLASLLGGQVNSKSVPTITEADVGLNV